MKTWILFSTNLVTLVGIYLAYLVITLLEYSGYYFTRAFEGMLWGSIIIFPMLIILTVSDSLYCDKKNKNWLIKETLMIICIIIFIALSKYSLQLFYIFCSIFLLTQIIKYFIFSKYCIVQEKN